MNNTSIRRPEPRRSESHHAAAAEISEIIKYDKILNPGSIVFNVEGAFIVDEDQVDGRLTPPDTRDIALPNHNNTNRCNFIAVDIGGSLAKVVYFTPDKSGQGGRLNFAKFETDKVNDCIEFMQNLIKRPGDHHIMATGGGSYKFYDIMKEKLGSIEITQEDEMACLIAGLDFFITRIPEEVFCYSELNPMTYPERPANKYPCLLVNIGSGVSMLKVLGPDNFVRIGGSSLGGGTLWGLLSLLTDAESYDDMLDMAAEGDNANVDMLVGDIYGTDYSRIGLKATTIASSFGKVYRKAITAGQVDGTTAKPNTGDLKENRKSMFRDADISRSLLYAVSNNIGQIAYLQAQNHQLEHIYFGGSYIRGHPQTMNTLSYAINFWSKGEKKAYFLRHEGYLGAVGAFMRHTALPSVSLNKT